MSTPHAATTVKRGHTRRPASKVNHPQNDAYNKTAWEKADAELTPKKPPVFPQPPHPTTPPPRRNNTPKSREEPMSETKRPSHKTSPRSHAPPTQTWVDPNSCATWCECTKCIESATNRNNMAIIERAIAVAQVTALFEKLKTRGEPECAECAEYAECAECAEQDKCGQCAKDTYTDSSTTSVQTAQAQQKQLAAMTARLDRRKSRRAPQCHGGVCQLPKR
jgi:hypothetical protein